MLPVMSPMRVSLRGTTSSSHTNAREQLSSLVVYVELIYAVIGPDNSVHIKSAIVTGVPRR